MRRSLNGKRVLLTGASSGIGWALAVRLIDQGCRVLVTARRQEKLLELQQATGNRSAGQLITLSGDITSNQFRHQLIEHCRVELGGLDILMNNAGAGAIGDFLDAPEDRLRKVMEVDFFAPVALSRLALPMLQRGDQSAIGIVGSVLGHRGVPKKSEYCAAKFAIRGWSESVRIELAGKGVDVIMISPSTTQSEFWNSLIDTPETEKSKSWGAMTPDRVAAVIIRSLKRNRRDVVLTFGGKSLVWGGRLAPRWMDRLLTRFGQ